MWRPWPGLEGLLRVPGGILEHNKWYFPGKNSRDRKKDWLTPPVTSMGGKIGLVGVPL